MARKYIDCRDHPQTDKRCSVAISADSDQELIEAVVQHAITVHGYTDTQEFRNEIMKGMKEGHPPA
jgi:predicted small metal-binding protein